MSCYLLSLSSKQTAYKLSDLIADQNPNERTSFRSIRIQSINNNPTGSLVYGGCSRLSAFAYGWELLPGQPREWVSEQNNISSLDRFVMGSVDGLLIAVDLQSA